MGGEREVGLNQEDVYVPENNKFIADHILFIFLKLYICLANFLLARNFDKSTPEPRQKSEANASVP